MGKMPLVVRNCPHLANRGDLAFIEALMTREERFAKCSDCDISGPNLWLCLFPDCRWVGCAETHLDHSTIHNQTYPTHCAHMNLSTKRIWCYACKSEAIAKHVPSPPLSPTQVEFKTMANKFAGDAPGGSESKLDGLDRLMFDK